MYFWGVLCDKKKQQSKILKSLPRLKNDRVRHLPVFTKQNGWIDA